MFHLNARKPMGYGRVCQVVVVRAVMAGGTYLCYRTFLEIFAPHAFMQCNHISCWSYRVIFFGAKTVTPVVLACGIMSVFDMMFKSVLAYIVITVP